eukprot:gene11088-23184_t
MGAASSIPDYLDNVSCQNSAPDLFSEDRFNEHANEQKLLSKEKVIELRDLTDVFLSHDWGQDEYERDNHQRVGKICSGLKARGLIVWYDEEKMSGNINEKMCSGINNAQMVITFITKRYAEKVSGKYGSIDNCRLEFSYSARTKGAQKIIPVVMENQMKDICKWTGEVGFILGGELYISFIANEELDSVCDSIYQRFLTTCRPLKHGKVYQACENLPLTPRTDSFKPINSTTMKPLSDLTIDEVGYLLINTNLTKYKDIFHENEVDGQTLVLCDNVQDIVSLGISILPKAKGLMINIDKFKVSGIPSNLLQIKKESFDSSIVIMKAIENLSHQPIHRGDRDRSFTSHGCWQDLIAYDWDCQEMGHSADANKSIYIGISELTELEDPGKAQLLLIKHFDGELRARSGMGSTALPAAIWGISFTTREMKEMITLLESTADNAINTTSASASASVTTPGPLIHREPWFDTDAETVTSPWLQETRWILENGKVVGILSSVKCRQDIFPRVVETRFKVAGERFQCMGVKERSCPYADTGITLCELWATEIASLPLPMKHLCTSPRPLSADMSVTGTGTGIGRSDVSYDTLVANMNADGSGDYEGIGADFQCELWLTATAMNAKESYRIVITTYKTNPNYWYIRTSKNVGSYTCHSPQSLHRLAYQAAKEQKTEIEMDIYGDGNATKIYGLIHIPSKTMYALKAIIRIKDDEGNVVEEYSDFMRLDYERVTDEIKGFCEGKY